MSIPPRLSWPMRLSLTLRSIVLPDLTRIAPLESLLRWYTPRLVGSAWAALSAEEILAAIDEHLAGCRRMRGRRCLRRGLLAFYFLRHGGYPAVLHIGAFVRPQGAALTHCWNSLGAMVDDPPRERCIPLLEWRGVSGLPREVAA